MQAAVAKPEPRKATAAPERKGLESVGTELNAGASAGMPAFLRRKSATTDNPVQSEAPHPTKPKNELQLGQGALPISIRRKAKPGTAENLDQRVTEPPAIGKPHHPWKQQVETSAKSSTEEACACGGTCSACAVKAKLQRKCASCDDEEITTRLARTEAKGSATQLNSGVVHRALNDQGAGQPLPEPTRIKMEHSFGVDLSDVRIHTGDTANAASRSVNAEAFTHGKSIYFAQGRFQSDSAAGIELLAHELTHVVQNRYTSDSPAAGINPSGLSLSHAGDPAEQEADNTAQAVSAGQPANVQGAPAASVQREEKGVLAKAWDWTANRAEDAGGAIASGVKAVGQFASDQLMSLLRTVAPQLADIIDEGPINFAKRKINEALDAHMPQALGGFSLGDLVDGVSGWLGDAAGFAKSLLKGDKADCGAFAGMMDKLTQFVTKLIDNPVIGAFTSALTKVSDFIGKVIKLVAEPIFDNIVKQVSGAWTVLKKVASTVSGWINKAKAAIGSLWDELSKALGFDGTNEDGVWSHIKKVGSEIWEGIKSTLAPVIEPIKKVSSVVALVTPMGQIHAIVKYGPKLVKVVTWLWDNGLNPDKIKEAPEEIRGMLDSLASGVDGFKGVLQSGLDWLAENLSALADTVLEVVGALTGLPLIGFAQSLFDSAQTALKALVTDIKKGAKDALAATEATVEKVSKFIEPYKEVISSFIFAIASPPMIPLIFAGWAWRKIPQCIKIPILNFVLDIAIAALSAIPALATFGSLWPLLKPGVLAFLGTLRAAEDDVKEKVSNKIAKVVSGASPEFLIGFVKGFATGVWEGLTDPVKAIWMVLEGLDTATQYLTSLAGFGDESEAKKQAPSAPAAALAVPTPVPTSVPASTISPAAESKPKDEKPYVADPNAALGKSGAKMPESTRKLLEKLAADKAAQEAANPAKAEAAQPEPAAEPTASTAMAPTDMADVKTSAAAMASEISPQVETVKSGFWDAAQEYFDGKSMSFDDMVTKLSEAWESAKGKISEGSSWLANQLLGFFKGENAEGEGELGDKIGWLTGTIVFQVLLDIITAGTWAGAGPVLKGIAKFINWPMEALGEAFKLLKTLGKYLLDGLKSLGSVIKDAAAGAFKTVSKALGAIGERLISFGEEILGKFGGKAAKVEAKGVSLLEKEGVRVGEQKLEQQAAKTLEEKAGQKLEQKSLNEGEQKAIQESDKAAEDARKTAQTEAEQKAGKKGEEKSAEDLGKKAEEIPAAQGAVALVEAEVATLGGSVSQLMSALTIQVKPRFGWIKGFEHSPIAPGLHAVFIRASKIPAGTFVDPGKFKVDVKTKSGKPLDSGKYLPDAATDAQKLRTKSLLEQLDEAGYKVEGAEKALKERIEAGGGNIDAALDEIEQSLRLKLNKPKSAGSLIEDANEVRDKANVNLRQFQELSPSAALGEDLAQKGFPMPGPGHHAHHVTPFRQHAEELDWLHEAMNTHGIPQNTAEVGVWLPGTTGTPNVGGALPHLSNVHAGLGVQREMSYTLTQRLYGKEGPEFLREYAKIMEELENGTFKHLSPPRGWEPGMPSIE